MLGGLSWLGRRAFAFLGSWVDGLRAGSLQRPSGGGHLTLFVLLRFIIPCFMAGFKREDWTALPQFFKEHVSCTHAARTHAQTLST